ncbi:MAG: DUF3368 domain-containing protein [Dolichospermum sp. WA123]|nr:DUF3368 domain-containing protein [Dolichospermum sp. WA123]
MVGRLSSTHKSTARYATQFISTPPYRAGVRLLAVSAKQRSLIPQVQPVMDALINQAGFRISPQLYQRILTLSQES